MKRPFYFVLFAVYPVLALFSLNIAEIPARHLILPFVGAAGLGLAFWVAALLVTNNPTKAAVITTTFLALFYLYGPVYSVLEVLNYTFERTLIRHIFLMPFALLTWFVLARMVAGSARRFELLTPFLNACALILIGVNLPSLIGHYLSSDEEILKAGPDHLVGMASSSELPDLYYFILDEYTGFEGVQELYGYDNSAFAERLRQRGFHVAPGSRVEYNLSQHSTASTLNMRLLEEGEDAMELLRNNEAVGLLKQRGYVVLQLPMHELGTFAEADDALAFSKQHMTTTVNDFLLLVMERSMLRFLFEYLISNDDYGEYARNSILFVLEKVVKIVEMDGPKLVYLHIHCPHFPFVFKEDGSAVELENFYTLNDPGPYMGQYKFITKEIEKVIDTILERSERPAAIILQSDHGHRGFAPLNRGEVLDVGETWRNVLNAFYFPGRKVIAADDVTPMRTMRLFFEAYGMLEPGSPVENAITAADRE